MKQFLFLLIIVFASSCASNTSFNTFYKNHEQDSDFSFGLSSSLVANFIPDEDLKPLLKKAKHVRILVFSEDAQGKTDAFQKFISRSKFEKAIKVKEDSDQLAFFTLEKKSTIKEIVLEISSGDELVLIGLKTNLSEADLDKLLE
jgi:hypothetical protein